jgi:hypothetical protein
MKTLDFNRPNNLGLLADELLAAVPVLRPVEDSSGVLQQITRIEARGADIHLEVPDDADESAIQAIVDAHDASATQRDLKAEARATGATKLKALGLTDDEIAALQG